MSNRNYDKVGGSGKVWNPKVMENGAPAIIDPNNPPFIEGYFVNTEENVGKHNSTVYVIHTVEENGSFDEKMSIWGDTVLSDKLQRTPIGSFVKIQYGGRLLKKGVPAGTYPNQTNSYHSWEVFVDRSALPYDQATSMMSNNPTKNTAQIQQQPAHKQTPTPPVDTAVNGGFQRVDEDDLPF
jgi:hypothetical protein